MEKVKQPLYRTFEADEDSVFKQEQKAIEDHYCNKLVMKFNTQVLSRYNKETYNEPVISFKKSYPENSVKCLKKLMNSNYRVVNDQSFFGTRTISFEEIKF